MKANKSNIIIVVLVVIIVAIAAFFGGVKYQEMHAAKNPTNMMFGAQGQRGQFAQRFGKGGGPGGFAGGAVMGQIVSADAKSITVKMQDGSSKIVNLSSSTKISKTDTASSSDLKTGQTVAVFGTTNSDGSVTAQTVQLNPQTFMKKVSPTPTQ